MEQKKNQNLPGGEGKRILTLGVGGAGCATLDRVAASAPDGMEFALVDCDAQTLGDCRRIETRLTIGGSLTSGMSAGGDPETGRRCAESDAARIESLISGTDLLLVVVGLGSGLGGGAAPVIARIARHLGAATLFFAVLPFPFEGVVVRKKASQALQRLRTVADAIVQMPNERIQPEGDALLADSLERSAGILGVGVTGIWRMLAGAGLPNVDFATLHTMLNYCDASCRFCCAETEGEDRAQAAVEAVRSHPLVDGGAALDRAPGMVVGITGGDDVRLAEVQQVMEGLAPRNETCWVKVGVQIDPRYTGRLLVMVLVAEAWKEPLIDDGRGGLRPAAATTGQGELAGVLQPRSRRFGGAERTLWKGEDLDVPTYIRRKIKLPR